MSRDFLNNRPDSEIYMYTCGEGNYWFYHKNSYPNNQPLLYSRLINEATEHIEIWDPHFNIKDSSDGDHLLFGSIKQNVTLKILTLKGANAPLFEKIVPAFKSIIMSSYNIRFGMRFINTGVALNNNWKFHDRFLIIDQTEVYLIGSSIGWHIRPSGSTGIFRVQNRTTVEFIQSLFKTYWDFASSLEIPVQYL